jgi:SAM-dependent methyltransferase
MFDGKRWAEVPAVLDGLGALLVAAGGRAPGPGTRVLDSCCGPGRHSLELARRGCRVTGVDLTLPYLEAAPESAAGEGLEIEFVQADVRGFVRPRAFDLALNLFTSFGYFATEAEDLAYLSQLRASLAPGGFLALEVIGKETCARDLVEGEWFERDGILACTDYAIEGAWEYLVNRWIIVEEGRRFERSFRQRLYSAKELGWALARAGFAGSPRFHGGVDGRPYDGGASSLLVLVGATDG